MTYTWVHDDRELDWAELSNLYRIAPLGDTSTASAPTVAGPSTNEISSAAPS